MTWWQASLLANVSVTILEAVYRRGTFPSFVLTLVWTWPLILVAQYGIWNAWRGAPSFLFAWAFFSIGNAALRLASSYWIVGEPPSAVGTVGFAMMLLGAYLLRSPSQ